MKITFLKTFVIQQISKKQNEYIYNGASDQQLPYPGSYELS